MTEKNRKGQGGYMVRSLNWKQRETVSKWLDTLPPEMHRVPGRLLEQPALEALGFPVSQSTLDTFRKDKGWMRKKLPNNSPRPIRLPKGCRCRELAWCLNDLYEWNHFPVPLAVKRLISSDSYEKHCESEPLPFPVKVVAP